MHIGLIYSNYENTNEGNANLEPGGAIRSSETATAIKKSLEANGHKVTAVETDFNLLNTLKQIEPLDLLFNLSTGISGKSSQANVVGMLEMINIPMLGSGLTTHVLGLHKEVTKSLLKVHHIRTARYQLVSDEHDTIREDFIYPLIVKPEHEGSGIGVTASSKVDTPNQLQDIIKEKIALHKQELLIEEYLPGREFTVGVMGNKTLEILPIKETIFNDDNLQMLTYDLKMGDSDVTSDVTSEIPADIPKELQEEIETMVEQTYRILRCQDFARIDVRLDAEGKPNIIELNTYPGLSPKISFFPMIAKAAGYSYEALINRLVDIAVERIGL